MALGTCPNGRQGIIRRREAAGKGAAVSANGQVRRAAGALAGTGRGAGRNREAQRHERPVEGVLQETPLDGPKKHPGVDCQSPLPPPWKGGTSLGESHDPPLCVPPPFSRAWSEPLPSLESATDATGERAAAAVPGVLRGRDPGGSGPGSHSAQPDSSKSTLRRETSPVKHSRSTILPTPCRLVGPDPSLAPSGTPARPWPARDPGRKQVRAARARR